MKTPGDITMNLSGIQYNQKWIGFFLMIRTRLIAKDDFPEWEKDLENIEKSFADKLPSQL